MNEKDGLPQETITGLRQLDTCTVSNAIETFGVRLRNEGFVDGNVRCMFPALGPMVGYAVTGRVRTGSAPIVGKCYYDHIEWWRYVLTIPAPRVVVLQDVDQPSGVGSIFGEIHANICRAVGCVGYVTNGAVRDLDAVEALGFHVFAGSAAVSHAYAHIIDFGEAVEIGRLKIKPGALLHGDRNGVHSVPMAIARQIPQAAADLLAREKRLIDYVRSGDFSLETPGPTFGRS